MGWVITIAVFIWFSISMAGLLTNGGFNQGTTQPYVFMQACGFAMGFTGAGIFLLFYYPYAAYVLFALAAHMVFEGWRELKRSEKEVARRIRGEQSAGREKQS